MVIGGELAFELLCPISMNTPQYTGAYTHKIDYKGRVMIPIPFRNAGIPKKFVVTRGHEGCLLLLTDAQWKEKQETVTDPAARRLLMIWSEDQYVDSQNRITLALRYREMMVTASGYVTFMGVGDHIELWAVVDGSANEPIYV